jgi:spermidine/putrescine transport system permease protein
MQGSQRRRKSFISPLGAVTALVYIFLYAPIAVLVVLSFNRSRYSASWEGFTWDWYKMAWQDPSLVASLRTSLMIALLTTSIAVIVGTPAALALARHRLKLKRAAEGLVFLPVIIPEIVIGFSTAALFGLAGLAFGLGTIVAAHVAFSLSYVIFIVRSRVATLDRRLEEAAMDLGASRWQTFTKVTIPLILPAIISAALLVFTISLDDYVITSFVAGPGSTTLPLRIYATVRSGVTPQINAISSVLLIATLLMVFVSERLAAGKASKLAYGGGVAGLALLLLFAMGGRGAQNSVLTGEDGAAEAVEQTPAKPRVTGGELNIYIWSNYLPDPVVAEFERRYGAKVNVELYDSNEALLSRLQAGGAAYDVIVPSDYMVSVLREQGLIAPISREYVTNMDNLDPRFIGMAFDPENMYSVAYMWGTTGIAYRKDKVTEPVESWSALWQEEYRDRILMLDDVRETFGAALKRQGKSLNSQNPAEIRAASRLLKEQKRLVRAYDSAGFDQLLLSGDVWIAQAYSGQIAKAMAEDERIGYVIPKEGCTIFVDNLCIPKGARNRELAHEFISFVLEPRIAAAIANGTGYSTANLRARALIRPELLGNAAAYPPVEALERCELISDIGRAITLYDRYWTEIKSE